MKYCITYRQYDDKPKPMLLSKVVPSTEKLKFYLDVMEDCSGTFELLSIVPIKED